jgi:hypothetical protein
VTTTVTHYVAAYGATRHWFIALLEEGGCLRDHKLFEYHWLGLSGPFQVPFEKYLKKLCAINIKNI